MLINKLRVDYYDDRKELYELMQSRYFVTWCRCFELGKKGENPHYHYYFESNHTQRAIRHFVTTKLKCVGNDYSFQSVDPIPDCMEYLAYMMKEGLEFKSSGIPTDVLQTAMALQIEKREDYKKKKAARLPVWKQCMEIYKTEYGEFWMPHVVDVVIKYYQDTGKAISMHQVENTARTVAINLSPEYKKQFRDNVIDRLLTH